MEVLDTTYYSSDTKVTFELLGSYFTNVFYNDLYAHGKRFWEEGKCKNIVEGYKTAMNLYLTGLKDNKRYKLQIGNVHKYYQNMRFHTALSYREFIDSIVKEFVPKQFFQSMNSISKDTILHNVITDSLNNFSEDIRVQKIGFIIDAREEKDSVRILQDSILEILLLQKEMTYNKFYRNNNNNTTNMVPKNVAVKMRKLIEKLVKENTTLKKTTAQQSHLIDDLKAIIIKNSKEKKEMQQKLSQTREIPPQVQEIVQAPPSVPSGFSQEQLDQLMQIIPQITQQVQPPMPQPVPVSVPVVPVSAPMPVSKSSQPSAYEMPNIPDFEEQMNSELSRIDDETPNADDNEEVMIDEPVEDVHTMMQEFITQPSQQGNDEDEDDDDDDNSSDDEGAWSNLVQGKGGDFDE